jgi:signal transduction histidine kinase
MSVPLHVLMVEDSEDDAELLLRELRNQGFAPTSARVDTGPALRDALVGRTWDVVISDHNMPGFGGEEALRLVKAHAPDVPFIVVSGTRGEEHAVEAMRAGASDFIVKGRLHRLAPVVERELHEATLRAEQKRMASALAESQQQLRHAQKLEAVGRLAGGVAHDFNNLLGAILGYADLVLKGLPAEDARRADLQEIKRASARAAELTRQLVAFSRQQVLDPCVLDLNEVISDVVQLLRHLVGDGITVETHLCEDLWAIKGDRIRIEQILMNLATNARDAMPSGGWLTIGTENIAIEMTDQPDRPPKPGDYVRLVVQDTGDGIPEEVLSKIFEPFFTTKQEGKGTGLGLATVHGIVQQSGGSIFVDSLPGEGARFSIYLPRLREIVGDAHQTSAHAPATPLCVGRVLVVQQSDADRERSVRVLGDAGFDVVVVTEDEAAAVVSKDPTAVGVLITDLRLSGTTGLALAGEIRAAHPDLPVVFLTDATDIRIDPLEVFERGDILVKPFAPVDLVAKVRQAFDARA